MAEVISWDGARKRYLAQVASGVKPLGFKGNQYTERRLAPAILSARTLASAARKLGGSDVLLGELQRHFERRAA